MNKEDNERKEKQDKEVIDTLKENRMYKQLSKEIVYFCHNNRSVTECVDFIMYELNLRCVDKNVLGLLAEQRDIKEIK